MRYLIGPELFWLLLYGIAAWLGKMNNPPSKTIDNLIDVSWFYIPLLSILVFGLWWIPSVEKNWLLLRVWIAGLILGHFVFEKVFSVYSKQGPGAGMGYLAALMLELIVLVVGTVLIKFKG